MKAVAPFSSGGVWTRFGTRLVRQLVLCAVLAAGVSNAQTTKPTSRGTPPTPSVMAEARSQLNNPDPDVSLPALEQYMGSDSMALREMAFSVGFASANAQMRALAMMGRLASSSILTFDLDNTAKLPEEEWKQVVDRFGGYSKIVFEDLKVVVRTGEFVFGSGYKGRIAGQTFSTRWGYYTLNARLTDGAKLRGTLAMDGKGTVPVVAELQ